MTVIWALIYFLSTIGWIGLVAVLLFLLFANNLISSAPDQALASTMRIKLVIIFIFFLAVAFGLYKLSKFSKKKGIQANLKDYDEATEEYYQKKSKKEKVGNSSHF